VPEGAVGSALLRLKVAGEQAVKLFTKGTGAALSFKVSVAVIEEVE
jgi:hypothetical protein